LVLVVRQHITDNGLLQYQGDKVAPVQAVFQSEQSPFFDPERRRQIQRDVAWNRRGRTAGQAQS
jgi:hypothetical protein